MTRAHDQLHARPLHIVPGRVNWILTGGELVEPIECANSRSAIFQAVELARRSGCTVYLHTRDGSCTRIAR
jgi:hypothetical protein